MMPAQIELQNIKGTLSLGTAEENKDIVDITQRENARRLGFKPKENLVDEHRHEVFSEAVDLNGLRKYYKKMKRQLRWGRFYSIFLVWIMIWFCAAEIPNIWGARGGHKISFQALESLSGSGRWAQIPSTVGIVGVFCFCIWNCWRIHVKRTQVEYESNLCDSKYYPLELSIAFRDRTKAYFSWRINLFWLGVFFCGLGLVGLAYGNAGIGWKKIGGGGGGGGGEFNWWNHDFSRSKEWGHYTALGGLLSIWLGLAILIISNPLLRFKIKKILNIFGLNEYNMPAEIRERAFKVNKRDKTICLVVLSILGLGLYIIFKRVIVAIYLSSFKHSRY